MAEQREGWSLKLFQREQRSLFGEILDWMLTPLLLLWPVSLALTWLVAQGIADKPYDRALVYNVQALSQLLTVNRNRLQFNLPAAATDILRADDADLVYFQVLGAGGELLGGERDLPEPPPDAFAPCPDQVHLRDDEFRGLEVRVAALRVPLAGSDEPAALVQVAETREKRKVLATEIIKGVMLPQFVTLPIAVLLVWLALVRGIKPLSQLEERIRARKPDDLSPLDDKTVPLEVAPLVLSVNDLLARLTESVATQKRFLADAAHQLKTPLAGLRMQADLARREGADAEELKRSLEQIGRASVRATHTVNQLLALARAEAGASVLTHAPCDLAEITMEVVRDSVPRALEKGLDLGYDGPAPRSPGVQIPGNATLLKEMVRNLVDNAIHYTPSSPGRPGVITVRLLPDPFGQVLVLQVEDNGPGVPEAERELIFEPFYRVLGSDVDGTGLGLPIVLEIARQHRATVSVQPAREGPGPPGALFSVRFALPPSNGSGSA
ncbi:MAG: sensor histidine kinase N-terminal domain-containing protein [Burkholderiaceae bacterium]|nr:MAG: sensor histidine kinase N-terminal domain-containing protein [Burkholderiaceae bacterium]